MIGVVDVDRDDDVHDVDRDDVLVLDQEKGRIQEGHSR